MIREAIRKEMKLRGIGNVHQLAMLTGVKETTLHRFFHGAALGSDKLEMIARAFGREWHL